MAQTTGFVLNDLSNQPIAFVGLAGTTAVESVASTSSYDGGKGYNYTLVVQVPIPMAGLNLNFNLLGNFVLPALAKLGIPQAITSFISTAKDIFDAVVEDVQDLLLAIPEASVTILVKVGPATILNVQLVAEAQPVNIPIPTFKLALPNFAIDPKFALALPFPVPPPVIIRVPIPVPVVNVPTLLNVTGGNVSAQAAATTAPQPFPVTNPVTLPTL